jgi:putative restriction endonuclease
MQRWVTEFASIRQWQRGSERAPHKPLLLLFVLGRLQQTGTSATRFADAELDLKRLLNDFGPPRPSSPAYPFHHLRSDGFWSVTTHDGSDPGASLTALRASQATGRLSETLEQDAASHPALIPQLARLLLAANWPPTLHTDILDSVGIEVDAVVGDSDLRRPARRRRDPKFRDRVLVAYEYRCAFCGYDGRLAGDTVALEAAHVQWHSSDGPDSVENALCLCSLHHKLLDLGVMGITPDHEVTVSTRFVGQGGVAEVMVLDLVGRPIRSPQLGEPKVVDEFIGWHETQVFRSPARLTP